MTISFLKELEPVGTRDNEPKPIPILSSVSSPIGNQKNTDNFRNIKTPRIGVLQKASKIPKRAHKFYFLKYKKQKAFKQKMSVSSL